MTEQWLEVLDGSAPARVALRRGLTRVGGPGADRGLAAWSGGELHFWDGPPRVLFVGDGERPRVNGRAFDESPLAEGDAIEWAGARLVFRRSAPVLEEIPFEEVAPATRAGASPGAALERLGTWVLAGVLAEQGIGSRKGTKRWQDAVLRGEFDADACARDLLRDGAPAPDDARVTVRAERLFRDLVMAPVTRGVSGTSRRVRLAAKGGTAMIVAQLLAISVYTLIVLVVFLLIRVKWDVSFDGLFDRLVGRGTNG